MSHSPLTSEQLAVVNHDGSHAIVGAVAGSGKTHTMIARVVRLLKQGVNPQRILVLMFNNSAQRDFVRRLGKRCNEEKLPTVEVLTFHAFGLRLLSRMVQRGMLPDARMVTEASDVRKAAKEVLTQLNTDLDDEERLDLNFDTLREFMEAVDNLKGNLYPCEDGRADTVALATDQRFIRGFHLFEEARKEHGMRMFSDMIYDPVMAALSSPEIAEFIGNRYDHIIVDEFQDINEAQMTLIRMVAGTRAFVMAVGDDDQCIYQWRGAIPDYMTKLFEQEFQGARRYTLSRTFRYGHALSLLANFVITNNTNRTDKICISGTERETVIDVRLAANRVGSEVVTAIKDWEKAGRSRAEAAILVREYAHSPGTEVALLQARIPYLIVGAPPFFNRADSLGLRAYLQLACGGFELVNSEERITQLVSALLQTPTLYLRKIQIEQIAAETAANPADFLDIASRVFQADRRALPFTTRRRTEALDRWLWVVGAGARRTAAQLLAELVAKLNLRKEIEKSVPDPRDAAEKIQMIEELILLAKTNGGSPAEFAAFLDQLADEYSATSGDTDRILVTSIHRAKGLEWPLVILPELSDARFPSLREGATDDDLESERRLFYVGATRAMERLTLISPIDRYYITAAHGGVSKAPDAPIASRFLYEGNVMVASEALSKARKFKPDGRCESLIERYRATNC